VLGIETKNLGDLQSGIWNQQGKPAPLLPVQDMDWLGPVSPFRVTKAFVGLPALRWRSFVKRETLFSKRSAVIGKNRIE